MAAQAEYYEMPERLPARCSAWIAVAPAALADPRQQMRLITNLGAAMPPLGATIFTGEHGREYRATRNGLTALLRAIERDPHTGVQVYGGDDFPGQPSYTITLRFGRDTDTQAAAASSSQVATIAIDVIMGFDSDHAARLRIMRDVVYAWTTTLHPLAAFVSDNLHDRTSATQCERDYGHDTVYTWPRTEQRVRGAFWCNYLGPDLCTLLGGREYVLAHAPVPIREALGDGVWLQTNDDPTLGTTQPRDLLAFLRPILPQPQSVPITPTLPTIIDPPRAARPQTTGEPVPVEWLSELEMDIAFHVYLKNDAADDAYDAVITTVKAWFDAGFNGAYPIWPEEESVSESGAFHFLHDPTLDTAERCIRWAADTGHGDSPTAFEDLAILLNMLPGQPVSRLAIGTEVFE